MRNILKGYMLFLFTLIVGSVYIAFAFSGPEQPVQRGEGASGISGWVVGNIEYTLVANNPALVSSISFTLDGPAHQVIVYLGSGNTAPASCLPQGGYRWQCETPGVSVASLDELRVIATGN